MWLLFFQRAVRSVGHHLYREDRLLHTIRASGLCNNYDIIPEHIQKITEIGKLNRKLEISSNYLPAINGQCCGIRKFSIPMLFMLSALVSAVGF